MAVAVDRAQSMAMNLQVLKRQDDAVMEIVDMASHVVVYEFDQKNQSWKRKDVEGCLFVVKRYASPRFQICINNRLSTTNMTIAVNDRLGVDSVDTFLILRSEADCEEGYAIYGLWFYPEEDRGKILKLLQRIISTTTESATSPAPSPAPAPAATQTQQHPTVVQPTLEPVPKQRAQLQQQPQQQRKPAKAAKAQQQQPTGAAQNATTRNGRAQRAKRENNDQAQTKQKPPTPTPTAILQRPNKQRAPSPVATNASVPLHPAPVLGGGYTPISKEDGIAAGNAILGMLGHQPQAQQDATLLQQYQSDGTAFLLPTAMATTASGEATTSRARAQSAGSTRASGEHTRVSKEQLKQTLIGLLDDPQFFDQIYHAYVNRVAAASRS